MDAVSALLRAAIRIADASAAIVAFDDENVPVAFAGCSQAAASAVLRDGRGAYIDCQTPTNPMTLILVDAPDELVESGAVLAMAHELGEAVLSSATRFDDDLESLGKSIETLADPVVVFSAPETDDVLRFATVNTAFSRLFGYELRDLAGKTDEMLYGSGTNRENVAHVRERLNEGEPVRSILECITREGLPLWIEVTGRVVVDQNERTAFFVLTLRDITARKEFESAVAAEKQRLTVTLKAIGDAVIVAMPDGRIEFINVAAQRLLDLTFVDAYGMPVHTVVDLRDTTDAIAEITFDPKGDVRGEGLLHAIDRNVQIAWVSSPMAAPSGAPFGYVIVLRDVTAQYRLTRRLTYEASHDPLTRLPNRRRFEEMVAVALDSARHARVTHTVAYIDLDRFKAINDTFGHQAGDKLLREVAQRMSLNVRGNDILARLGGDEFGMLLHECTPANAQRVAEKIREAVEGCPCTHDGFTLTVSASVGLAALDEHSEDAAMVLAEADRACYLEKASRAARRV